MFIKHFRTKNSCSGGILLSTKLFQNFFSQIKESIEMEFGVMDETGVIVACTEESRIGDKKPVASEILQSKEQYGVIGGIAFTKVYIKNKLEYIAFAGSDSDEAVKYLTLIAINLSNLKMYYDEKFDRTSFMKDIITAGILPGEILMKAKELHIPYNLNRVAFLIRTGRVRDTHAHDIIQGLFPNKAKDFVIVLDDENTVLIKELKATSDFFKEIEKTAKIIIDTLNTELMIKAFVGIGTIVENITDIGRSFKEAQMALLIGGIFERDKAIVNYNSLGLGRLIYQIPMNLCDLFLKEVFKEGSIESLDNETMFTIQKFFENNLNVSETSRQLYVHRNTLVYRLDKIQKVTGLDLRNFDDAIIFKVAMLVKSYIDNKSPEID